MKTKFDDRFNEVDAANMRMNMTELVIYGIIAMLMLAIKASANGDDDKKKRDVVAVMYNNKRNKVKFASKNEVTGLPHFYTEEIDLSNGDHVRYYGTFMAKENTSFGKRRKTKRKTSKLENDLKYLLKL
jgi:hypothetical protein